jgi:spore coat polysaccharide biosynthesis protein SpsF
MKILTVIQARRGSSRLPDKVLKPILGIPTLIHQINRVKASMLCGTLVVATTNEEQDNAICELCEVHHVEFFRGHSTDLLDRHLQVGLHYKADAVVKIPSDCPLIDPKIIDEVLQYYNH